MIHDKCKEEIEYLRQELKEARAKNDELQEQLLTMKHPVEVSRLYPVKRGTVTYVDDERAVELEAASSE